MTAPDLRYPVGRFAYPGPSGPAGRAEWLDQLAAAPAALRAAVAGLDEAQLDTPYRPGGWTVRQVAHHLPDSHVNGYVRCKLALTEQRPTIRTYEESAWAELPDARGPVEVSLRLLGALHERWVALFRALPEDAWKRLVEHPEWERPASLEALLALYAWHGRHHVAHITGLRAREGW